jgi:hypothetical protein
MSPVPPHRTLTALFPKSEDMVILGIANVVSC